MPSNGKSVKTLAKEEVYRQIQHYLPTQCSQIVHYLHTYCRQIISTFYKVNYKGLAEYWQLANAYF